MGASKIQNVVARQQVSAGERERDMAELGGDFREAR